MLIAFALVAALSAPIATPTPLPLPTMQPQPSTSPSFATPPPTSGSPTATGVSGSALTPDQMQQIDAIAGQQLREQAGAGLALAVVRQGKVVYTRGYGFSSAELQQGMRDSSLFEIGSITKEFTAAAVLLLAEQSKVGLDDLVSKYVPDYPHAKEITVRELLSNTSGVPDYTDAAGFDKTALNPATPDDVLATIKQLPLDFTPGTQWEYSNSNDVLLGMIVERASGEDYGSYVDTEIFQKVGMTSTKYGNVGASSPDLATGYTFDGAAFKLDTPWNLDWAYAAGGIVSNVLDLAVWDAALPQGSFLSPPSLRSMWTSISLKDGTTIPYGYGWSIETLDGHREIDTNGGLPGYNGCNATFPNDGFDVVVLANTANFNAGPVVKQVFEMFFPPTAAETAAQNAGDSDAAARARSVFHQLQTGTLSSNELTAAAQRRLTSSIESSAKAALGRLGQPTGFSQTDRYVLGDQTVYTYRVTLKQAVMAFSVAFDGTGKVGSFSIWPL